VSVTQGGGQKRQAARVLVADDDDGVRRQVGRALEKHGYVVIEAADGVDALSAAAEAHPDLAIVDLRMPRLDGFEVVRSLKEQFGAALPVLVLSGMDGPDDRVRAFDVGADDFVAKPVHIPELLRRLEAFERTRRAYLEVRRANEQADRLRVFAAEAAALLAHDLKNGLSVAISNLQFVEDSTQPGGEVGDAFMSTMRALRRMSGLVRNFVDISRLEDAALTPTRAGVDIGDLLGNVAGIHGAAATHNGARVMVECPELLIVHIDPVLIERVVHNLLGNALRYVSPGGAIRLRAWVDSSTSEGGARELVLDIANTGNPIDPNRRATLFEKYATGGDAKSKRGMGLYFCRMACEAHGGSISLSSEAGFPTVFVVRLPIAG
jgi:signal transduction histidine kinase